MIRTMVHAAVSKRRRLQGFYIWFVLSFMAQKLRKKSFNLHVLRDFTAYITARPYMVSVIVHAAVSKRRRLQGFYIWFVLWSMTRRSLWHVHVHPNGS